jgi:hypothetical protein
MPNHYAKQYWFLSCGQDSIPLCIITPWNPRTKTDESIHVSETALRIVIATETATYALVGFLDQGSDQIREVMEYQNYSFTVQWGGYLPSVSFPGQSTKVVRDWQIREISRRHYRLKSGWASRRDKEKLKTPESDIPKLESRIYTKRRVGRRHVIVRPA